MRTVCLVNLEAEDLVWVNESTLTIFALRIACLGLKLQEKVVECAVWVGNAE